MTEHELTPDTTTMGWLLNGEWEFPPPPTVLEGITPRDACRRMGGLPHTIAELVAHMNWWQQVRIEVARDGVEPDFSKPPEDWPRVAQTEWEDLVADFLAGLEEITRLAGDPVVLGRDVFGDRNAGNMLVSHATHNAWHLGQVVLLRRLQGTWPPE